MAYAESVVEGVLAEQMPKHIAVIMDGNGRWAKKRFLQRREGHRAGAKAFHKIVEHAEKIGIQVLTAYAFSTENWKRPQQEIDTIMELLEEYLDEFFKRYEKESSNIRLSVIGDISALRSSIKDKICVVTEKTRQNSGMVVNIALNYGGRDEIVNAARVLAEKIKQNQINAEDITEELLSSYMYTAHQPDPDIIIRPSGEKRLSNFLLWQSAYSELVFMDVLWPDFKGEHMEEAIREYAKRNRRYGGV